MSEGKRLGILLFSGRGAADLETALNITKSALCQGIGVEIFMMAEAVDHIFDPRIKAIAEEGAKVTFCAQNARERNLTYNEELLGSIKEGSQYDLAGIVREADRFLPFI